jgi:hypothetical protein
MLPGHPNEFNLNGEVTHIVQGDASEYETYLCLHNYDQRLLEEIMEISDRLSDLAIWELANKSARVAVSTLFISSLLETLSSQQKISRSEFFKEAARFTSSAVNAYITIFGLGVVSTGFFSPRTRNEFQASLARAAARIPGSILDNWWVDGRTALMIAKTQDAIDYLKLSRDTPSAVVFGTGHYLRAHYLLNSKERERTIRDFIKNLLYQFDILYDKYKVPPGDKTSLHRTLIHFCASTYITDIRVNPTAKSIAKDDISFNANFESPQVLGAISDFL